MQINIPTALSDSDIWRSLNDKQQRFIESKLGMNLEMASKAICSADQSDTCYIEVVDDIELDAIASMGGAGNIATEVSSYQVHSTWTAECNINHMSGNTRSTTVDFLRRPFPLMTAPASLQREWLDDWGRELRAVLVSFSGAKSYEGALANLLLADALVFFFLTYAALYRLDGV